MDHRRIDDAHRRHEPGRPHRWAGLATKEKEQMMRGKKKNPASALEDLQVPVQTKLAAS